jgi:hypothetical protein
VLVERFEPPPQLRLDSVQAVVSLEGPYLRIGCIGGAAEHPAVGIAFAHTCLLVVEHLLAKDGRRVTTGIARQGPAYGSVGQAEMPAVLLGFIRVVPLAFHVKYALGFINRGTPYMRSHQTFEGVQAGAGRPPRRHVCPVD